MNFLERIKCKTCNTFIDCRIGLSNRDYQPLKFCCPNCGEAIDISFELVNGIRIKNLKMRGGEPIKFDGSINNENPFIDLHLDFPVSFDSYVMGMTAYLKSVAIIGHENYNIHNARLNALNFIYKKKPELERILRLYSKNVNLFGTLCEKEFHEKLISKKPEDVNATLYCVIAKIFAPFSMPTENIDSIKMHMNGIIKAISSDKTAFNIFIEEIISTNFLKNIQHDCLEIYPQILNGELAFRPALFLDFIPEYHKKLVAFRVSTEEFQTFKDLYKDISEILSRQLILVAGINNIIHRKDHNKFKKNGNKTPKSLNDFADIPYGLKMEYLDDSWYTIGKDSINNQLRNSIAHVKVKYDDITQIITYYPKKEGIKQEKSESIYFIEFMRNILISYREMHRLHQLIKCLFNHEYLVRNKAV